MENAFAQMGLQLRPLLREFRPGPRRRRRRGLQAPDEKGDHRPLDGQLPPARIHPRQHRHAGTERALPRRTARRAGGPGRFHAADRNGAHDSRHELRHRRHPGPRPDRRLARARPGRARPRQAAGDLRPLAARARRNPHRRRRRRADRQPERGGARSRRGHSLRADRGHGRAGPRNSRRAQADRARHRCRQRQGQRRCASSHRCSTSARSGSAAIRWPAANRPGSPPRGPIFSRAPPSFSRRPATRNAKRNGAPKNSGGRSAARVIHLSPEEHDRHVAANQPPSPSHGGGPGQSRRHAGSARTGRRRISRHDPHRLRLARTLDRNSLGQRARRSTEHLDQLIHDLQGFKNSLETDRAAQNQLLLETLQAAHDVRSQLPEANALQTHEPLPASTLTVRQARHIGGEISVPGDKSLSHRAVLFSALADGTTVITGFLPGRGLRLHHARAAGHGLRRSRSNRRRACIVHGTDGKLLAAAGTARLRQLRHGHAPAGRRPRRRSRSRAGSSATPRSRAGR